MAKYYHKGKKRNYKILFKLSSFGVLIFGAILLYIHFSRLSPGRFILRLLLLPKKLMLLFQVIAS